jgi:hypothetical protein
MYLGALPEEIRSETAIAFGSAPLLHNPNGDTIT